MSDTSNPELRLNVTTAVPNQKRLQILILEDVAEDLELVERELGKGELTFRTACVVTKDDFTSELQEHPPDVILADHGLPAFDGFSALELARKLRPDVPFIFVTGSMGEELAIDTLRKGATDYVLKTRLSNLLPAVRRALREREERTKRKEFEDRLKTLANHHAAIAEFGKIALIGIDPALLMADAVEMVAGTLHVEFSGVFELLSDGSALRLSAGTGWEQALIGLATTNAGPESHAGFTIESNAPVLVSDASAETQFEWPAWMREQRLVSGACVPIKGREYPFGVLGAHSTQRRDFSEDDVYFLEAIAYRLGAAVERRRAHEEISRLNAELEDRVLQRTAELKAAYQEMEAFSYSISHDLRAPLRHIAGFVELLQAEAGAIVNEPCQGYLNTITEATHQMSNLIEDLLELSRTSRAELHKTRVNLADLVLSSQRVLSKEMQGRDIQWVIGELPDVEGDPGLLRQAMINLLSNALKYTRSRRQTRIELGCSVSDSESVFFIRDNGVGFDMQYAGKLFGVFQRLHRSSEFEGTGIGLANVRRIIERHGGRAWAEGREGEGATFYFALPNARALG